MESLIDWTTIYDNWDHELGVVVVGAFAVPLVSEVGSETNLMMNVMSQLAAEQVVAFVCYYCGQPQGDMAGRNLVVD